MSYSTPSHRFLKGFAEGLFMLLRQPRVGDIVEDYCPRERRVSDHAVVAMVGDGIRQTRCTTCDTEHEYREGKVPPGRKKSTGVLPPKPPSAAVPLAAPKPPEPSTGDAIADAAPAAGAALPAARPAEPAGPAPLPVQEGHVHRRLIRAVLPRVEGEVPTRQAPEFTMHRPLTNARPGRQAHGGAKAPSGQSRYPGPRTGAGQGYPAGPRQGRGGPRHSGPSGLGGSRQARSQHGGGHGPRKKQH